MRVRPFIICALFIPFLFACKIQPKPIQYGMDVCAYCSMTIVDKVHAAQIVTQKGKVYSYDAIECMLNEINKVREDDIGLFLINELAQPGKLIDATKAYYLKSPSIPSPMGANLSAFSDSVMAYATLADAGGKIYDWKAINAYFKEADY